MKQAIIQDKIESIVLDKITRRFGEPVWKLKIKTVSKETTILTYTTEEKAIENYNNVLSQLDYIEF